MQPNEPNSSKTSEISQNLEDQAISQSLSCSFDASTTAKSLISTASGSGSARTSTNKSSKSKPGPKSRTIKVGVKTQIEAIIEKVPVVPPPGYFVRVKSEPKDKDEENNEEQEVVPPQNGNDIEKDDESPDEEGDYETQFNKLVKMTGGATSNHSDHNDDTNMDNTLTINNGNGM
jgi:hypothetical protein